MTKSRKTYFYAGAWVLLTLGMMFACTDEDPPTDPGNGNDPKNTPMVVETNLPTSYRIDNPPQHSIRIADEDEIKDGMLSYRENDNLIWEKDLANLASWDTTWTPSPQAPGEATLEGFATDKFSADPEERSFDYKIELLSPEPGENTPTQFTADTPTLQVGEQGNLTFSATDTDTLDTITFLETRPDGSTNEFSATPNSTDWDTTFTRTYTNAGDANWKITATDKHPQPETKSKEYTTTISEQPTTTYTLEGEVHNPVLNMPATGVQLELLNPEEQQLDQATSDSEGRATLKHTQEEDKPTNNHTIQTSGLGYETQNHNIDLADENFNYELTPTQILTNNPNWSIEPRDSIRIDLADAVDRQGVPLEKLIIQNTSNNVSARQENQTTYWLRVENDAANTQEEIDLEIRTTTNKKTHNIPITIQPREPISYTNTNFEVQEQDTLTLDLLDYISSGVGVDSTHISSTDSRLEVVRDAANEYRLIPQENFAGNIQLDLYASNKHGSETNTTGTLEVQGAPRITIRVENNETDQHTTGLEAHLGVYDTQGTRVDTLSSNNGIFEIKLTEQGTHKILARYTREGETFSYLRTDYIENTGVDQEHLTRIVDFYIREQDGTIVGELQEGEPGIANPEGFRQFATGILNGVSRWNSDNNIIPTERGTFNYYTESQNQRGPDKILVAEVFHSLSTGQTSYLQNRVKNIQLDVYENDIAPWMGEFAPETEVVDSVAFDAANNQFINTPLYAPNDYPFPGEVARLGLWGEAPNSIYSGLVLIRSDGQGTYEQLEKFTSQEAMGAFGIMSRTQADDWAENYQSSVYDATVVQRPTNLDGKLMRAVWERTYGPPVRDPSEVLYVRDVFGKPDY